MSKQKGILIFGASNMLVTRKDHEERMEKRRLEEDEKWNDKLYYELHEEMLEERKNYED